MTPEELLWRRRWRERDETSQDDADDGALARIDPKTGTENSQAERETREQTFLRRLGLPIDQIKHYNPSLNKTCISKSLLFEQGPGLADTLFLHHDVQAVPAGMVRGITL